MFRHTGLLLDLSKILSATSPKQDICYRSKPREINLRPDEELMKLPLLLFRRVLRVFRVFRVFPTNTTLITLALNSISVGCIVFLSHWNEPLPVNIITLDADHLTRDFFFHHYGRPYPRCYVASVSKRVFMRNHSYENEIPIQIELIFMKCFARRLVLKPRL